MNHGINLYRGFTDKDFRLHKLRFNQNFQLLHADQFMADLFSSQAAQSIVISFLDAYKCYCELVWT